MKFTIPSALKKEIVSTLIALAVDLIRRFIFRKKKTPEAPTPKVKTIAPEPVQPTVFPTYLPRNNRRNTRGRKVQFVNGKRIVHSK
jgi:hypothetical protein